MKMTVCTKFCNIFIIVEIRMIKEESQLLFQSLLKISTLPLYNETNNNDDSSDDDIEECKNKSDQSTDNQSRNRMILKEQI